MGCSLATSLVTEIKKFRRNMEPDFLFIEPSEIVLTHEMRSVSSMGLRDIKYAIGPFITLVDGPGFDALWEQRRPLILGQLERADLVAVSRTDLLDTAGVQQIVTVLREYAEKVIQLSALESGGIEEVVQMLDSGSPGL